MPEEKLWEDSLWMDCFFELLAEARKEGKGTIVFADVDRLVIAKSYHIVEYTVAGWITPEK